MTILPSTSFIAPSLQDSIQEPTPTHPLLHSPLWKPDSQASLQDAQFAKRAFPAALPAHATKAMSFSSVAGVISVFITICLLKILLLHTFHYLIATKKWRTKNNINIHNNFTISCIQSQLK
jgi:hypothetical protein